jgi:basic membrane lipoprotein Med (substrate-binding protein (PBP1-ABC) superfamily)
MSGPKRLLPAAILGIGMLVMAACGGSSGDGAGTSTGGTGSADTPTELRVAAIFESPLEDGWNASFVQSWNRVIAEKPHGLTITLDTSESIALPDGERVLRQLAESGKYDIIVAHSSYSDAVQALKDEFPDIMWVYSGSGNQPLGGNAYWYDSYLHESDYLCGIIAGMMTKTNVIGAVAAFPYPNVNSYINGYAAGAKSVNPDVKVKATYINSWFDPQKAKEAASAQIAAGADFLYAESFGTFEAVRDNPGTLAFGHYVDQNELAPDVIVTSDLSLWDPAINNMVDTWWDHTVNGTAYDAPMHRLVYLMKQGGTDIAPFHNFDSKLPQDVKDAVEKARQDIMDGTLKVPFDGAPVKSE